MKSPWKQIVSGQNRKMLSCPSHCLQSLLCSIKMSPGKTVFLSLWRKRVRYCWAWRLQYLKCWIFSQDVKPGPGAPQQLPPVVTQGRRICRLLLRWVVIQSKDLPLTSPFAQESDVGGTCPVVVLFWGLSATQHQKWVCCWYEGAGPSHWSCFTLPPSGIGSFCTRR